MKKLLLSLLFIAMLVPQTFAQQPPHSVDLTWIAPVSGGTVTGYNVLRGIVTGGPYTLVCGSTFPPCPTLTSFTDTSGPSNLLTEGVSYYYVVKATGPGGVGPASNEAKALIPFLPPGASSGLSAQPH